MNILITGASKGIGFELVQQFANQKENNIVAVARDIVQLKILQSICEKKFNNIIHIYSIDFLSKNLESQIIDLMSCLPPCTTKLGNKKYSAHQLLITTLAEFYLSLH